MTVAEHVVGAALTRPGEAVFATGGPGAGKSATARSVAAHAAAEGLRPVLVAPPSGAADAGAAAVMQTLRRLGEPPASDTWTRARRRAFELLRDHAGQIVLVCDEPSGWSTGEGHFTRRAAEAADLLAGPRAEWPVVVCDRTASGARAVGLPDAATSALREGTAWGELADAALALAESGRAGELRTPLQQRLAAALLAWGATAIPESTQPHDLALALAERLSERRWGRALWAVWQRLALERLEASAGVLDRAGAAGLDGLAQRTLDLVLLDGGRRLHDVLRRIPEERPVEPELREEQKAETHEALFDYHFEGFATRVENDDPTASEHAGEALYHAAELGDETRQNLVRVDLADQLNALGHRRAVVYRDYAGAALIFSRALEADADDAFAVHHRAFMLDALGQNAQEVADRYTEALALEPARAAWHARRIGFLADTAALSEARRAWAQAEAGVPDDRDDPQWYADLHLPVAAALLAHGELAFAAYVLDGVPGWARPRLYDELRGALEGRLAAQDTGAFVPAPRSGEEWWTEGPARLPVRDTAGRALAAWMAGRIDWVDDESVHIHVARVEEIGVRPGRLELPRETWKSRLIDEAPSAELWPGLFVEIGRYEGPGTTGATAVAVLREEPVPRSELALDPGRWLRGVGGASFA